MDQQPNAPHKSSFHSENHFHPLLSDYLLHLADNTLILGQRNSEWTGHGPILEQDIALSNISLDLIGQARMLYQYAADTLNDPARLDFKNTAEVRETATEDTLAYLRDSWDFKNCLLVELENGDWAGTILRQFFFSAYQFHLYEALQQSKDQQLASIAEKAWKEVAYHLRWSSEWVIRLGDGTEESHRRMENALSLLWMYTGELITPAPYETVLAEIGIAVNPADFREKWVAAVQNVFSEATLKIPENTWMQTGGKQGKHTEHLGYILTEMQFLQRTYPNTEW
jgi:ring-1,2-phenylacetyl-CoA epoxidase subunit PaaC